MTEIVRDHFNARTSQLYYLQSTSMADLSLISGYSHTFQTFPLSTFLRSMKHDISATRTREIVTADSIIAGLGTIIQTRHTINVFVSCRAKHRDNIRILSTFLHFYYFLQFSLNASNETDTNGWENYHRSLVLLWPKQVCLPLIVGAWVLVKTPRYLFSVWDGDDGLRC